MKDYLRWLWLEIQSVALNASQWERSLVGSCVIGELKIPKRRIPQRAVMFLWRVVVGEATFSYSACWHSSFSLSLLLPPVHSADNKSIFDQVFRSYFNINQPTAALLCGFPLFPPFYTLFFFFPFFFLLFWGWIRSRVSCWSQIKIKLTDWQ